VVPDVIIENNEHKDLQIERAKELLKTSSMGNTTRKG
jgi:hypothetical protein